METHCWVEFCVAQDDFAQLTKDQILPMKTAVFSKQIFVVTPDNEKRGKRHLLSLFCSLYQKTGHHHTGDKVGEVTCSREHVQLHASSSLQHKNLQSKTAREIHIPC